MRRSSTVGFAIDEADRERLDRLAAVFGAGNRSAFLRKAMDVMERYERAQQLTQLQAYGEERLVAAGWKRLDVPSLVEAALADPDPEAVAQAKLIVAGLRGRHRVQPRSGEGHPVAAAFAALLDDEG
ncbi:MAG: hypothetical protein AB1679_28240 [Actinomycetota bacterium]